jgi:hypothetical protein
MHRIEARQHDVEVLPERRSNLLEAFARIVHVAQDVALHISQRGARIVVRPGGPTALLLARILILPLALVAIALVATPTAPAASEIVTRVAELIVPTAATAERAATTAHHIGAVCGIWGHTHAAAAASPTAVSAHRSVECGRALITGVEAIVAVIIVHFVVHFVVVVVFGAAAVEARAAVRRGLVRLDMHRVGAIGRLFHRHARTSWQVRTHARELLLHGGEHHRLAVLLVEKRVPAHAAVEPARAG